MKQAYLQCILWFMCMVSTVRPADVTLSPGFFDGKITLSPTFQKELLMAQPSRVVDLSMIIGPMNYGLEKCHGKEKEMFISILNQSVVDRQYFAGSSHEDDPLTLLRIVLNAIRLTKVAAAHGWFGEMLAAHTKSSLIDIFTRNFKKQKPAELFEAALLGDRKALKNINLLAEASKNISDKDKIKLLLELQIKAAEIMLSIDHRALRQTQELQFRVKNPTFLQHEEIRMQQEAHIRAVLRYAQDILDALRPMCSHDERLLMTIDQSNLRPILNSIDLKKFQIGSARSMDELKSLILKRVGELKRAGDIRVPDHESSKVDFMNSVADMVLRDHPEINEPAKKAHELVTRSDQKDAAMVQGLELIRHQTENRFIREHVHARLNNLVDESSKITKDQGL